MPVDTVARPLSKRSDCDFALRRDLQEHLGNKDNDKDNGVALFNDHVDPYGFFEGFENAGGLWDGMKTPEKNKINSSPVTWFYFLSKQCL